MLYSSQLAPKFILQTIQEKLPFIAIAPGFVKAGALAALYSSAEESGCLAGGLAQRILRGEKAEEMLSPSKVKSAINLIVAQRLNVFVDPEAIKAAEVVVQ